jgi:outer membrane protein assembly factor BamB
VGTSTSETLDPGAQSGEGKVYAFEMASGQVIFEQNSGNTTSSLLVEDEHLYFKTDSSGGNDPIVIGGGGYNNDTVKRPNARAGMRAWKEIW